MIEAVIAGSIEDFFKSRQKPSMNALHKEVRRRCVQQGLRVPCWSSVRDLVATMDSAELITARGGAKAARSRYHPVPRIYGIERTFEVAQIDHTLVDVNVVDRAHRLETLHNTGLCQNFGKGEIRLERMYPAGLIRNATSDFDLEPLGFAAENEQDALRFNVDLSLAIAWLIEPSFQCRDFGSADCVALCDNGHYGLRS